MSTRSWVLLVIDMQVALFSQAVPRFDADGVVMRINRLSRAVRASGGRVIFIQHGGPAGDELEPGKPGWEILPALNRKPDDPVVCKTACDAFYNTGLADLLKQHQADTLIITGCATDFCVDTTVRSAAVRQFDIYVAGDSHTTADRPHLDARSIITHHNWMWENLIVPGRQVQVKPADVLIRTLCPSGPGL